MKSDADQAPCLGFIYGNRDFFPDKLVTEARADFAQLCGKLGIRMVQLSEQDSKLGGLETHADARKCAALFKGHADELDGIVVVLPNFGDEKGVADTLKLSGLKVPVLVQAYPDDLKKLDVARRRDGFCGKISVCNNLVQAGIKYSVTRKHVAHPADKSFLQDLESFIAVCRVVNGLRGLRLGAVGARPGAFNTVRYSEKILERHGISVTTVDLSEIFGKAEKLDPSNSSVSAKLAEIKAYAPSQGVPAKALEQMAKLGVVLSDWMATNALEATAIQCWTSVQTNYGCNTCTLMSMMSERFMPSACEVDVTGALTMYAMQLARTRRARSWTGTTITRMTRISVSCFTAAIGRRRFCPISKSPPRRFSGRLWASKIRMGRWRVARPPARSPSAASLRQITTAQSALT